MPHPRLAERPIRAALGTGLALGATIGTSLLAPPAVLAHELTDRFVSPLPLTVYLAGAAFAVALSFGLVLTGVAGPAGATSGGAPDDREGRRATPPAARTVAVPRAVRLGLRGLGLAAWLWVVVQGATGSSGEADVPSLVLWTYGWVGLALVSALAGPIWEWLDPFATLHDLGAAAMRRLGLAAWSAAPYPSGLGRWPATAGFGAVVWLELAVPSATGGRDLALALVAYTVWTLAMMAQFGRDAWRANGEVFSVWFATLGRLAPLAPATAPREFPERLVVRRFGAGLHGPWARAEVVLVAFGVGSVIYDGLSQSRPWVERFGSPGVAAETLVLAAFLGGVALLALSVARLVGLAALGAGLVPVAVGYVAAHYLTALLVDGQRVVAAVSDPLGQGWNLLGLEGFEPSGEWLPPPLVWAVQVGSIVLGHVGGAIEGHAAALREAHVEERRTGIPVAQRTLREPADGADSPADSARLVRRRQALRQVPLAVLMVALTTLTLWTLGQEVVVHEEPAGATAPARAGARRATDAVDDRSGAATQETPARARTAADRGT